MRGITVAARDKMTPRTPQELATDHANILKSIDPNTFSIEKAVWTVDLMMCERIKLNSDDQEKYVTAITGAFPEAIKKLTTVQGLGFERSDFLQEIANLAKNITPRTKDLMDVVEAQNAKNDLRLYKKEGVPLVYEEEQHEMEDVMANVLRLQQEEQFSSEVQKRIAACLGKMRTLHDVASLGEKELLRLEGQALMDQKDKLSLVASSSDVAAVQKEMENYWYQSCLTMMLKKTTATPEDIKHLFPGAIAVHGPKQVDGGQAFLVKFNTIDDLVSVSETLGSDDNISYDCIKFHRPVGNEVNMVENDGLALRQARAERWAVLNDLYYGKDRDLVNFPMLRYHEDSVKNIRYKVLPEPWFDAMYNKTGVSGPHFTLYAIFLFLCSKQYLVLGHHQVEVMLFMFIGMPLIFKWNTLMHPFWQEHVLRKSEAKMDYIFTRPRAKDLKDCEDELNHCHEQLARLDLDSPSIQAMSENVDLQLEAEYRQRLNNVHNAVKKRLDYQAANAQANKQFHIEHMVNWIVDNVNQSITPQLEKETMKQCFIDLAALSKKHAGQI